VRAVLLVARHVFKDSVRDRVLYGIGAFAVLLIAAAYLIGQLTAGQDVKIIQDLGLAAISLFGLFIAIFIGIGLVWKELDRRSVYAVLAKPVGRPVFVLGKYVGLLLTLLVNVALMSVAYYVVLAVVASTTPVEARAGWETEATSPRLLVAVVLIYAELAVVTAMALFFSTFSSPFLSAALTLGLWVAGQFVGELRHLGAAIESPVAGAMGAAFARVLPDFARLDVKAAVIHGQIVSPAYVGGSMAYAAIYAAIFLIGSVVVFTRRDLK